MAKTMTNKTEIEQLEDAINAAKGTCATRAEKLVIKAAQAYLERIKVNVDWVGLEKILRHARAKNESCSLELTNWIADNKHQPKD